MGQVDGRHARRRDRVRVRPPAQHDQRVHGAREGPKPTDLGDLRQIRAHRVRDKHEPKSSRSVYILSCVV